MNALRKIRLVIALVVGLCVHRLGRSPSAAVVPAQISLPVPVPVPEMALTPALSASTVENAANNAGQALQAAADAASVKVEQGAVRFYFASGDADLADGAGAALGEVVKAAKAGRTLVITGFHDATGDAQKNAALARQRALAVREALKQAGVSDRQIVLKKPEQLVGGGSDAEARRVEITLQ
jgi:K(+)-stimulated pyrophosphate-energized sodium pump